jgi:hypothetical protein
MPFLNFKDLQPTQYTQTGLTHSIEITKQRRQVFNFILILILIDRRSWPRKKAVAEEDKRTQSVLFSIRGRSHTYIFELPNLGP